MSRRRPTAVAALLLSAALLSACGTGLEAQTYRESGRQDMAETELGDLAVRNLHVTPPLSGTVITTSDDAVLQATLVNTGDTPDALTAVTSDVATSAELQDAGKPVTTVPVPARGTSSTTWAIVLSGLTRDLDVGTYISMTLTFQNAGRVTLQVPIRAGDNGLDERKVEQNPYGESSE